MTPTATTPAARRSKAKPRAKAAPAAKSSGASAGGRSAAASPRSAGHRGDIRRQPAPRSPRRVSGPARPARRPASGRLKPAVRGPLPARVATFVRALPDHPLLDRMVRGRAWIPLLGVLLAGIVAMQVEVLKLSATMGRSLERGTALQSRNDQLRASVATLSDDQRIERLAAGMGMVMPNPTAVDFLSRQAGGDVQQAVARLHAPDVPEFVASLPAISTALAAGTGSGATVSTTSAVSPGAAATAATTPAAGSTTSAAPSGTPATSSGTPVTTSSGTPATNAGGSAAATPSPSQGTTGQGTTGQGTTGQGTTGQQPGTAGAAGTTGAAAIATGG